MIRVGGDYQGNEFIISSGKNTLLNRNYSGPLKLDLDDQKTLEWAGVYWNYHAAMMSIIQVGRLTEQHSKDV